jgi:hypothetical protein
MKKTDGREIAGAGEDKAPGRFVGLFVRHSPALASLPPERPT